MVAQITINPYLATNAAGLFYIESKGLYVGTALPDPSARNWLAGGWLDSAATMPMWGGVGISENIPNPTGGAPIIELGPKIARATANANLTGFSVYDQDNSMLSSPQSPVQQTPPGGQVLFYRVGSRARVILEIDSTLTTLEGGLINQAVGWDFTNQKIIAGSGFPCQILEILSGNCISAVYNSTSGFLTENKSASAAVVLL